MAAPERRYLALLDFRGGRNGTDPLIALPLNQLAEAVNVDWFDGTLGRKRAGAAALSMTGANFTGTISSLFRHVPGAAETAAELWAVDDAATPIVSRLSGGTTWVDQTLTDAIATRPMELDWASFNGKLFIAFDSTVDRLHVWDATNHRRVGLATPAAPTVANTGAGTYAAVLRYYRVRYTVQSGGNTIRRSEPSSSVSFTPSGTGTAARVTKPATISESETHWELEASLDDATFFRIATTVVGTTTYDDSASTSSYAANTASDAVGTYVVPTSPRYLLALDQRLILAGAWESGGFNSRVWFTPILGTSTPAGATYNIGDDERIVNTTSQKNWIDVGENDGAGITGLGGPLDNTAMVFKYRQTWKLVPTGVGTAPFRQVNISKVVGCIFHRTICLGEDEAGNPAIYWLDSTGPYRYGSGGLEYLGRDVEDLWATISLGATNVVAHGIYHPVLRQVWWWISTGTNDPDLKIVYDVTSGRMVPDEEGRKRGGWAQHDDDSALARCSVLFANTPGASMSRDLKPYIGQTGAVETIWRCDVGTTDATGLYQAYITTRPYAPQGAGKRVRIENPILIAEVSTGVTIRLTIDRDFGAETDTSDLTLTADGTETIIQKKFEDIRMAAGTFFQFRLGDSAAVDSSWTLLGLIIPYYVEQDR